MNGLTHVAAGARTCLRAWRRIPRAGRVCFAIAFVNVAVWSVVVPPFQVPDEISHFAYAQYFAETGQPPPQGPVLQYSPQEYAAIDATDWGSVIGNPMMRGVMTVPEDHELRVVLAANTNPLGPGGTTVATNQPPLYYALEAIPYWLSPSNDILTRLVFMRLLSALMAAGTVLAVFLFLRELMPGTPWTWTVGALMVAFQPMFDFIGAGVQGDNLLYLASALTFFVLARAWRRGLTVGRGAAIGGALALGMLAKLTFLALMPGAGLALLALAWRARRPGWQYTLRMLATSIGVAVAPVALYALLNVTAWGRGSPFAGGLASVTSAAGPISHAIVSWHATLDYAWELFLPRLPFMNHVYFPGESPLWTLWLNGSIGHFGILDYTFPAWVYNDFKDLVYALAALSVIGLVRLRHAIRPLLSLFACYAVMASGLLAVIGYLSAEAALSGSYPFPQARYLFPLLALYALGIVLATKALPRRWAPVLGGLLVVLAMAHSLFAETLTISRYYG
jgi:4-amino-4-deoxy-L-arabinose transferase-like glycosyltransferase